MHLFIDRTKIKLSLFLQKFKRLRRIQDEESEGEEENDPEQEREHIAADLFSEDVSIVSIFC